MRDFGFNFCNKTEIWPKNATSWEDRYTVATILGPLVAHLVTDQRILCTPLAESFYEVVFEFSYPDDMKARNKCKLAKVFMVDEIDWWRNKKMHG